MRYASRMRAVLVLGLVGCIAAGSSDPVDPLRHDPDDPAHCDGLPICAEGYVCALARYGCLPADEVYAIHLTWTVAGQLATSTSCAAQPELIVEFTADQASTGLVFSPVPCSAATRWRGPRGP